MKLRTDPILQRELYSLYTALFHARRCCPADFENARLTTIITAILSIKTHSWRVIGITREALVELGKVGFDKKTLSKRRLCRGHRIDRSKTTAILFDRDQQMSCDEFIETVLQNDCTVIMLDEQNYKPFPEDFIPIDNPSAELFPNGHAGWMYRKKERDYLKQLHACEITAAGGE